MKGLIAGCLFPEVKAKAGKTYSGRMVQVVQRSALGTLLDVGVGAWFPHPPSWAAKEWLQSFLLHLVRAQDGGWPKDEVTLAS